jgi:hypothetical protein
MVKNMDLKTRLLLIGNVIFVFLTLGVNSLANILPINGKYTGELSDNIPNLFVPLGITFSIWGVIYVLLFAFAIYQIGAMSRKSDIDTGFVNKIGPYFMLASIGNIVWIFLWHYEYVSISLLPMLLLFMSLLVIYVKLQIGLTSVPKKERFLVHLPISVYLGWITVATIANVTAVLVVSDVNGLLLGEALWTMLVIAVAALITLLVIYIRNDFGYSLVIVWALLGIALKRLQIDPTYGVQTAISTVAILSIILILIFLSAKNILQLVRARKLA